MHAFWIHKVVVELVLKLAQYALKPLSGSIIKWFGFDEVGTQTPQCLTAITKFTAAQVDTSQYQTDHIFEPQTVLQFFDFLRGGGQFGAGISMPTGYTAASSAWVNDVLLNYESGSFSVQLLTGTYAGHSAAL